MRNELWDGIQQCGIGGGGSARGQQGNQVGFDALLPVGFDLSIHLLERGGFVGGQYGEDRVRRQIGFKALDGLLQVAAVRGVGILQDALVE